MSSLGTKTAALADLLTRWKTEMRCRGENAVQIKTGHGEDLQ
jgi:hypothetical protein